MNNINETKNLAIPEAINEVTDILQDFYRKSDKTRTSYQRLLIEIFETLLDKEEYPFFQEGIVGAIKKIAKNYRLS